MGKREIKLITQIGIGLGAVLLALGAVEAWPTWVMAVGAPVYIAGIIFN